MKRLQGVGVRGPEKKHAGGFFKQTPRRTYPVFEDMISYPISRPKK
jgi:hypothetical protein